MDEYVIQVAGLPARASVNGYGYFATVAFQNVFINGSPLIVYLDPPVSGIDNVGAPTLLALVAALANGAIIQGL